ncbi:MAG: hypothetical protein ACJAXH_003174, partial [Colwellia sp.]
TCLKNHTAIARRKFVTAMIRMTWACSINTL